MRECKEEEEEEDDDDDDEEDENGTNTQQEWTLRDKFKFQGTTKLPEVDLQEARKEDGATYSLIKTGEFAYNKEG